MFCHNCGIELSKGAKFCSKCGMAISSNEINEGTDSIKKSTKGHWLMWWQINEDELENQVARYERLGMLESARGQASILLAFSATLTVLSISFWGTDSSAYIDALLFVILALFIYAGKKIAIILAMLLWTLEKIYTPGTPVASFLWWAIYMGIFWKAYKVEQLRAEKFSKQNNS